MNIGVPARKTESFPSGGRSIGTWEARKQTVCARHVRLAIAAQTFNKVEVRESVFRSVSLMEISTMAEANPKLAAICAFKDWSNYLLVTTIAALGWVAGGAAQPHPGNWLRLEVALLGFSAIFGVLTLAVVPIITQNISAETKSIYDETAEYKILYLWGPLTKIRLKTVCWPQHVSLILAIGLHAIRYSSQ